MFDLIGDVHGYAEELETLLRRLGYRERRGVWRHAERTVLFVGDLVDRGPRILEAVRLVRRMEEAGSARVILGNHEWNLLGYCTPDPARPGDTLRRRTEKNANQHRATLEQLGGELETHLDWIRALPFHLDLGHLRVVHACWDSPALDRLAAERRRRGRVTEGFLVDGYTRGNPLRDSAGVVLKGPEIPVPEALSRRDTDGHRRGTARIRWYLPSDGHTLGSYCLPEIPELLHTPLPESARELARPYPVGAPLLFVGHFALVPPTRPAAERLREAAIEQPGHRPVAEPKAERQADHARLAPNIVCLDLGVAKPGGALCAYRFDGEPTLDPDRFEVVSRS
ncbi:MAG: metallophosphoesterase [Thermoanaerobaculia bacterium]